MRDVARRCGVRLKTTLTLNCCTHSQAGAWAPSVPVYPKKACALARSSSTAKCNGAKQRQCKPAQANKKVRTKPWRLLSPGRRRSWWGGSAATTCATLWQPARAASQSTITNPPGPKHSALGTPHPAIPHTQKAAYILPRHESAATPTGSCFVPPHAVRHASATPNHQCNPQPKEPKGVLESL